MPDDDRWTVRGVSPLARQRATAAARAARMPVGEWLTAVITNTAFMDDDMRTRLETLERAVFGPASGGR